VALKVSALLLCDTIRVNEAVQFAAGPEHPVILAELSDRRIRSFDDLVREAYGDAGVQMLKDELGD